MMIPVRTHQHQEKTRANSIKLAYNEYMAGAFRRFSNVIGVDDAPFQHDQVGRVKVVGTVYAGLRFDGMLIGEVEKDGFDAAAQLAKMVGESKFSEHAQLLMLQGISLAGFNVVDVFALHEDLGLPVLVVARREPDLDAVKQALFEQVSDGREKWAVIEKLGPMEAVGEVFVQRVGLTQEEANDVVSRFAVHGHVPEPIRTAHLIAGALEDGESRGRV
jgi:endonuclease V-like protein UPF0215 family